MSIYSLSQTGIEYVFWFDDSLMIWWLIIITILLYFIITISGIFC